MQSPCNWISSNHKQKSHFENFNELFLDMHGYTQRINKIWFDLQNAVVQSVAYQYCESVTSCRNFVVLNCASSKVHEEMRHWCLQFRCQYQCYFSDCIIIYVVLDICTQKQSIIRIFLEEICYCHHGQGREFHDAGFSSRSEELLYIVLYIETNRNI